MKDWPNIAVQLIAGSVIAAALLAVTTVAARPSEGFRVDPRYATPRATLETYFRGIAAVDEEMELGTGTPEVRAQAERNRGRDKEKMKRLLAGKMRYFERFPPRIIDENILGDRAKILVYQGGTEERPIAYVYSFRRINGNWKISDIEITHDMSW